MQCERGKEREYLDDGQRNIAEYPTHKRQTENKGTHKTHKRNKLKYDTKELEANHSWLVNWSFENDLFNLAHSLNVVLQSLAIYFKHSPIAWVFNLDSTIERDLFHHKRASPT